MRKGMRLQTFGGLAALYYGYAGIPEEWLAVIKRRDWIEDLCSKAATTLE